MSELTIRQRLVRGAQAQAFNHAARVFIQVVSVGLLVSAWGLDRFGDWLILTALTSYIVWNDVGFVGAAMNEMTMAVGRDDRPGALAVFQATSIFLIWVLVFVAVVLPLAAFATPVADWLNLVTLDDGAARSIVVLLGLNAMLLVYSGLIYGAFAAVGRYGEAGMWSTGIFLVEFGGLAAVVIGGGSPVLGAAAMLGARAVGSAAMYVSMRRRVPWIRFGIPRSVRPVLRRLWSPALASGAFPAAAVINVQGMVLVIGLAAGPAAVAVFSTVRTMSRSVVQLTASVFAVITPEISRAFGETDERLLRSIHRRGCQAALWLSVPLVVVLTLLGGPIIDFWTSGEVSVDGLLLYIFLVVAVVDSLWFTSLSILFGTNRHQRVATYYFVATLISVPAGYGFYLLFGLEGAAFSILLLEASMLAPVLRQALPAAHDSFREWLSFIVRPPLSFAALIGIRARLSRP